MLFPVVRNLVNFKKDREQAWLFLRHGMWRGIVPVWIEGLLEPVLLKQDFNSTLEPNNILYLSDYQIIHSILVVI